MKAILWTCTALAVALLILATPRARAEGDEAEANAKLQEKLEAIIPQVDFKDAPLMDVLRFIGRECDLPIVFDEKAEEIAAKAIVTVQLKDVPVKAVLKFLLASSGLTYRVVDGEVRIVFAEAEAESAE